MSAHGGGVRVISKPRKKQPGRRPKVGGPGKSGQQQGPLCWVWLRRGRDDGGVGGGAGQGPVMPCLTDFTLSIMGR